MSPLSHGGATSLSRPDPDAAAAAPGETGPTGTDPTASPAPSGFPVSNGAATGAVERPDDCSGQLFPAGHDRASPSIASTTTASTSKMSAAGGGADGKAVVAVGGSSAGNAAGGGSSSRSLARTAAAHVAAKTFVSNTINRRHGRTTDGAVVLKAAAWGIEPRLALDKKTHAALEHAEGYATERGRGGTADGITGAEIGADGTAGRVGGTLHGGVGEGGAGDRAGGRPGRQFLKFEAWSTRAAAASSPWAAHPSMRRQASGP